MDYRSFTGKKLIFTNFKKLGLEIKFKGNI